MATKHKQRKRRITEIKQLNVPPQSKVENALFDILNVTRKKVITPEELFLIRDTVIPQSILDDFFYKSDGEEFEYHRDAINEMQFPDVWPYPMKCAGYYILRMNPTFFRDFVRNLPDPHRDIVITNLVKALTLAENPHPDF